MRRFRFRKNTIFYIYLVAFTLFFSFSSLFLVYSQSRLYKREIADLRSRVSLAERASAEVGQINSVSSSREYSSVSSAPGMDSNPENLYWIEGTGKSKRWWYMDVVFYDGERFRYFLHLPLRRNDLTVFHRRFMHDALFHYRDPVVEDFDPMASDML